MTLAPECSFQWDGAGLFVFVAAIPLAILLTVATLLLYRRAVGRAMRAAGREAAPHPAPAPASPPGRVLQIATGAADVPAAPAPMTASRRGLRRLGLAYAAAGIAHASVATTLMLWLNALGFSPARWLLVWAVFAWPIVAVLAMTSATTRRAQVLLVASYFALLLLLEFAAEAFGLRYQPGFGELFVLWAVTMGPPTAVILLLSNRAWRPVGLVAMFVSIVLVAAYTLGFQLLGCLVLSTRSEALLSAAPYLRLAIVLACAAAAWLLLRRVARRYRAKRTSDQMFTLDSWWLLVTALQVLFHLGALGISSLAFFAAFAAYRLVLRLCFALLGLAHVPGRPRGLLLLRVFGHSARVRTLADRVGQRWRHAGPINMIGGTDLAAALLEPDELMSFWGGKLREGFVASPPDLEARLERLDEARDPDGRYRINEFFCHDDTWRAAVHALAQRSAVVLMDLRGFGKENRGCEFELGMLLDEVPLERVLLLTDGTTRLDELEQVLATVWGRLSAASPNRLLERPLLHLFRADDDRHALPPLMSRLFEAAGRA